MHDTYISSLSNRMNEVMKGADFLVKGSSSIARRLKISDLVIGLTVVAFGTSSPEQATSAVTAYRKNVEIAVDSVIGSNIFNIFFILGLSSVIKPLPFQKKQNIDIGVMVFANFLLFFSMFSGKKRLVDRWEGILFILLYLIYITFLVIQG